jgi:hypothetical protein
MFSLSIIQGIPPVGQEISSLGKSTLKICYQDYSPVHHLLQWGHLLAGVPPAHFKRVYYYFNLLK